MCYIIKLKYIVKTGAREMHQSVKCLPFVEEDLSLISKIHTALVIPRLGKQRQGGGVLEMGYIWGSQ